MSSESVPNFFANDGSFLDQFRKKIANQNNPTEPDSSSAVPVSSCQKKIAPFRPKTACKRINMKASLKKQLKTDLADKGTSDKLKTTQGAVVNTTTSEVTPRVSRRWDKPPPDVETRRREEQKAAECFTPFTPVLPVFSPDLSPATSAAADGSSPEDNNADPTRKRKRKSRWGQKEAESIVQVINGVPIVIPTTADIPADVTARALASLVKKQKDNKYEYDSDEDVEDGTWEHKQRLAEIKSTDDKIQEANSQTVNKHHLGDFLPKEELERFYQKVSAAKKGTKAPPTPTEAAIGEDNVGYKMLQKAGWKEGSGLGATGSGIVAPIDRGSIKPGLTGLGAGKPDDVSAEDDEFDIYRKRMMLAYRYRPNPMKNPRRAYY